MKKNIIEKKNNLKCWVLLVGTQLGPAEVRPNAIRSW